MCGRCGRIRCDRAGRRHRKGDREISPDAEGGSLEQSGTAGCRPRRGAVDDAARTEERLAASNAISAREPGKVDGAFAELPRYFADADRVMDLETRILWCMEKLQGFNRADLVKKPHPGGGQPVKELGAMATYVASKSSGMKFAAKLDQPKEKDMVALGETLFFRRSGPFDFACATCHDAKRSAHPAAGIAASVQPGRGAQGGRRVAGLSGVDHPRDDHAAPPVRLLLADADAGARARVGRERGADLLSREPGARAARSPPPVSSAECRGGDHANQHRRTLRSSP